MPWDGLSWRAVRVAWLLLGAGEAYQLLMLVVSSAWPAVRLLPMVLVPQGVLHMAEGLLCPLDRMCLAMLIACMAAKEAG